MNTRKLVDLDLNSPSTHAQYQLGWGNLIKLWSKAQRLSKKNELLQLVDLDLNPPRTQAYVSHAFVWHRMWHAPRTPSDLPIAIVSGLLPSFAVSCHMMAEGINSFAYKYCLSSLAATVAETGINSVSCHIFKRQVRILTWHISHDIIWSWCFGRGDNLRATTVICNKRLL